MDFFRKAQIKKSKKCFAKLSPAVLEDMLAHCQTFQPNIVHLFQVNQKFSKAEAHTKLLYDTLGNKVEQKESFDARTDPF